MPKRKTLYSSYWMPEENVNDDDFLFDDNDGDDVSVDAEVTRRGDPQRLMRLASLRRAIGNFASIVAKREIPVQFADKKVMEKKGVHGLADGERVIISAETNPKKFDMTVGVALHEGAHILLSDFNFRHKVIAPFARNLEDGYLDDWYTDLFHPEIVSYTDYNVNSVMEMFRNVDTLVNFLEDFRIDKYVYENAPGYRPYYDALYDELHNATTVTKNLMHNPEWHIPTVENYIFRVRAMINPAADPLALPGLAEIYDMVNLENIERLAPENDPTIEGEPAWSLPHGEMTYDNFPNLWKLANEIYVKILRNVALVEEEEQKCQGNGNPSTEGLEVNAIESDDADTSNTTVEGGEECDTNTPDQKKKPRAKYNATSGDRARRKLIDFANGNMKKKKLSAADVSALAAIESANAEEVIVHDEATGVPKVKCMVINRVDERVIDQDWFLFKSAQYWADRAYGDNARIIPDAHDAIAAGRRMGAMLVNRLQVRNDPQFTKYTRLPNGNIDRRLLSQLGMDLTNVFARTRVDSHTPAMLHLTLDASGSMNEYGRSKWNSVLTVATALAYVGSKLNNIEVVITIRGGDPTPMIAVVHDSRRNSFSNFLKTIRYIGPAGYTPEGLAFKATMDMVLQSAKTHDVYFINFSDGIPYFPLYRQWGCTDAHRGEYSNHIASNHTMKMVNELRANGVKVLSYFIGPRTIEEIKEANEQYGHEDGDYTPDYIRGYRMFQKMYGQDAEYVDVTKATMVLRTLNRRLEVR